MTTLPDDVLGLIYNLAGEGASQTFLSIARGWRIAALRRLPAALARAYGRVLLERAFATFMSEGLRVSARKDLQALLAHHSLDSLLLDDEYFAQFDGTEVFHFLSTYDANRSLVGPRILRRLVLHRRFFQAERLLEEGLVDVRAGGVTLIRRFSASHAPVSLVDRVLFRSLPLDRVSLVEAILCLDGPLYLPVRRRLLTREDVLETLGWDVFSVLADQDRDFGAARVLEAVEKKPEAFEKPPSRRIAHGVLVTKCALKLIGKVSEKTLVDVCFQAARSLRGGILSAPAPILRLVSQHAGWGSVAENLSAAGLKGRAALDCLLAQSRPRKELLSFLTGRLRAIGAGRTVVCLSHYLDWQEAGTLLLRARECCEARPYEARACEARPYEALYKECFPRVSNGLTSCWPTRLRENFGLFAEASAVLRLKLTKGMVPGIVSAYLSDPMTHRSSLETIVLRGVGDDRLVAEALIATIHSADPDWLLTSCRRFGGFLAECTARAVNLGKNPELAGALRERSGSSRPSGSH